MHRDGSLKSSTCNAGNQSRHKWTEHLLYSTPYVCLILTNTGTYAQNFRKSPQYRILRTTVRWESSSPSGQTDTKTLQKSPSTTAALQSSLVRTSDNVHINMCKQGYLPYILRQNETQKATPVSQSVSQERISTPVI